MIRKVSLPIEGGCQCGGLRYQVGAPPVMIYACHCANCQRIAGSAFGLSATIETGDYHEIDRPADIYFSYCWPGQMYDTEQRFIEAAPDDAMLLICHGAEDVRCKVKQND